MGKMEGVSMSEVVRLARREVNRVALPLRRDVRSLKRMVSEFRKTILELKQFADRQRKQLEQKEAQLTVTPDAVKKSRFSPRIIRALRKRLGLSQRELATLSGVTEGAVYQWETGKFVPKDEKKGLLVALRKLGRRGARELLSSKTPPLTTLEACNYLRISRPTYLKYLYAGKIKGVKVGKGWKVLKLELDRFLKGESGNTNPNPV
jgi:excisionase family DNA binding protein